MDKNFIRIDDLIVQRLGGVEEKERSGSWLNMRELLDKEMPQERPGGIIYWSRTFSVVAVLSLLATIAIGGYEFSNSLNNHYADNNTVIADAAPVGSAPVAAKGGELNKEYKLSAAENAVKQQPKNENSKTAIAVNDTKETTHTNGKNSTAAHDHHINNQNKPSSADNNNADKRSLVAVTGTVAHTATTGTRAENNETTITHKRALAHNENRHAVANKQSTDGQLTNADNNAVAKKQKNTRHAATEKVATEKATATTTAVAAKQQKENSHEVAANKAADKTANAGIAANTNKTTSVDKLPLGSSTPLATNTTPAAAPSGTIADKVSDMVNGNVPVAKEIKADAKNGVAAKTDTKSATARNNANTPGTAGNSTTDSKMPANNPQKMLASGKTAPAPDNTAGLKNVTLVTIPKGKKVIERLVLHERYIKTAPNEGYFKLDTVSIETMTTELGLNGDITARRTSVKKQFANNTTGKNASKVNGTADDDNTSEEGTTANGEILPGAAANGATAPGLKPAAAAAKKTAGSIMIQKLNATFNDFKYQFGAPKFQVGVTAGINGTFFGPNNFKGFDFGLTGNLVFNDQWSILSELKYFQRVNGNTSIQDNYSTYTPAANGQYTKTQQLNSYSFSALHSLEMPVSIRYCMGNFNFFAGGNLVYTFSINTGAETIPVANSTPVMVAAPGDDNGPKLKAQDFNSRFGLGYLLGLSYSFGPNTMMDFRSVQTVWDNSNGAGAKSISSQLYKSPSLQLSIIYRLGGGRNKGQ